MNSIGLQIKINRKFKKISQFELAEKVGISQTYLSQLENNFKNPGLSLLVKIATELNVTLIINPKQ